VKIERMMERKTPTFIPEDHNALPHGGETYRSILLMYTPTVRNGAQ